jgi:glyoxylase-like metal-dependent hydrolase (beta-lactamase superfamily II)
MKPAVEQFISAQGTRVYRIPLKLFPGMHGYAHLVLDGPEQSLFDVGSGFGDCNEQLDAGLHRIHLDYGESVGWQTISKVFISHGHIDHYGGLHHVRQRTNAPIIIHELERRVLTDYDNRLAVIAGRLENYLIEAGVSDAERPQVMDLYLLHKQLFSSIEVQATYEELGMQSGNLKFEHVPGHCPGQVIAWVDDILLSSDHILKETSPHQAPERLSLNMGLEHYLASLATVLPRAGQARWTMGGHEGVIADLSGRIYAIVEVHRKRLYDILALMDEPKTICEISNLLFPQTEGYHRLLALEETGAHVEYLHTRGYITNQDGSDLDRGSNQAIRYLRLGGDRAEFPGLKIFSESTLVHVPESYGMGGVGRAVRSG